MTSRLRPLPTNLEPFLRALWPEPCAVASTSRLRRLPPGTLDFVALPSGENPRLLVPRSPRRCTASSLRNYNTGAPTRSQLRSHILSYATRLGLGLLLPRRITIAEPESAHVQSIHSYLARALGQKLALSVYIGFARAVQKPILQIMTLDGQTIAFAKVGVDTFTRELVRREASNLAALRATPAIRDATSIVIPDVLHTGAWNGLEILVQQALPRGQGGRPPASALVDAMLTIARSQGTTVTTLGESTYWKTVQSRVGVLGDEPYAKILKRLTHELGLIDCELTFGSWHGDFAPWNMTHDGSSMRVWDWEHLGHDVPLGFDALHLRIQSDVVMRGIEPRASFMGVAQNLPEVLGPLRLTPGAQRATFWLYVIEIALRYLEDHEPDKGTALGSLVWLPPVSRFLG